MGKSSGDEEARQHLRYYSPVRAGDGGADRRPADGLLGRDARRVPAPTGRPDEASPAGWPRIFGRSSRTIREQIEFVIADGLDGRGRCEVHGHRAAEPARQCLEIFRQSAPSPAASRFWRHSVQSRHCRLFVRDNGAVAIRHGTCGQSCSACFSACTPPARNSRGPELGSPPSSASFAATAGTYRAEAEVDRGATFFFTLAGGPSPFGKGSPPERHFSLQDDTFALRTLFERLAQLRRLEGCAGAPIWD